MRHLRANCTRVHWIVALCLVLALAACSAPRTTAVDPATIPPSGAASPAGDVQDGIPPSPVVLGAPGVSTKPGLFGILFKRPREKVENPRVVVAAAPPPDGAGPGPEVTTGSLETETPKRGGLFGFRSESDGVGTAGPHGALQFGEMVKACGVNRRDMGKEVAKSQGRGIYKLFDTDPTSIKPRTQYITGFKDGCARQFTASLALFGTAQVHETTRYNPLNSNPYTKTDLAYEKVKIRVCGVGKGKFCPDRGAKRMDRETSFLSVYRDFGGSGSWMEVFLHQGRLVSYATLGG